MSIVHMIHVMQTSRSGDRPFRYHTSACFQSIYSLPVSQAISVPHRIQISLAEAIGPELRHRASVALRQQPPSTKLSPPRVFRIGAGDSSAAPEWQIASSGMTGWTCRASCRRQVNSGSYPGGARFLRLDKDPSSSDLSSWHEIILVLCSSINLDP